MMLTRLNPKALIIGLIVYLAAYGIYAVAANIAMDSMPQMLFWILLTLGGLFAMSVGGFVAGLISGKYGWLHGLFIAISGAVVITIFIQFIAPGLIDQTAFIMFIVVGGFLNTGAGWLGQLKRKSNEV